MSPAESGETQPAQARAWGPLYELAIKVLFPIAMLVGGSATGIVFAHDSRLTVVEERAKAEKEARVVEAKARAAEAARFQKGLDEIKSDVKKLLEKQ